MPVRTHNFRIDDPDLHVLYLGRPNRGAVEYLRQLHDHNWKILLSYKATSLKIPSPIADYLIKRGMSNGERVCLKCHNLMVDNGKWRCDKCKEEALNASSILHQLYRNKKGKRR